VTHSPPPRILLIETSGRIGAIGIAAGSTLLAEKMLDETRRHARDLVPAMAELLRGQRWRPKDLDAVFVSLGPGSYTGLRVGVMSAKTLAYATGCAAIGVPTFLAIARQVRCPALELTVVADAQKNKLYVQRFRRESADEDFAPASEVVIVLGPEWAAGLGPGVAIAGPGTAKAVPWLRPENPAVNAPAAAPAVGGLLSVGLELFTRGVRDDLLRLEPLYQRPSSAEEQWDRRPG
jgi:tRNA threonylcarbamoyladenosine biosynthesis protein TsaB